MPTLPRTRSSKRRKRWAISYPVLSDGFHYPLSLGSAHPIEMWRSNKLGIKEKISRGNFPRLIFSCPVPSGLPHRSHCVPMNMNPCGYRVLLSGGFNSDIFVLEALHRNGFEFSIEFRMRLFQIFSDAIRTPVRIQHEYYSYSFWNSSSRSSRFSPSSVGR